ncbi:MAG: hypothetical protein HFE45_11880 [Oscillospiraceae bacterium]|jgi:hypothetical protein|nr:hypothetical protein [Oscillospiraceae bacterium]
MTPATITEKPEHFGIYCMSINRWNAIMTKNLFEYCTYVVREEQADKYREAGIDDLLVIPAGAVHNFMTTFYWIIENTPEEVICIVDDDIPEEIKEFDFSELHAECEIPEWVYDCHTHQGKAMGKTKIEMIRDEQAALQPLQLSLFDDGDWSQFVEPKRAEGNMSAREEAVYKPFAARRKRYY